MRYINIAAIALLVVLGAMTTLRATMAQDQSWQVARGRYLATRAGQCSDCHGAHLEGASLDFLKPGLPVMYKSPRIAGLPNLSTAAATHFLETGELPDGRKARPPMPQFRFNHEDASAIVAYLKALK